MWYSTAATCRLPVEAGSIKCGLYYFNLTPVGVELFCHHHGERGHNILTKLRVRREESYQPVCRDRKVAVESAFTGSSIGDYRSRFHFVGEPVEAQHKASGSE